MCNAIGEDKRVCLPVRRHDDGILSTDNRRVEQVNPARSGRLVRALVGRFRRNWARELWDWARCKQLNLPTVRELTSSFEALDSSNQGGEYGDTEAPIFLLATGWRSGSTLLQRILVTDPNVLLWGEPLGEMALLPQMADMLARLSPSSDLARSNERQETLFSSLPTSWIATLSPPGTGLRQGLQSFLVEWLCVPARRRGFSRWGFKEVRLGAVEATLLHWIFPKARFILLSRNPYDCYRSLADSGWHHLYHSRPDVRVDSAAGIARHWNRTALSWTELPESFPVYRIKYEDLIARKVDFRALESWLGVKLNEDIALSTKVGGTARRRRLGLCERWIISHEAKAGMLALGYSDQA
jgi:Sulfotransferase family